LGDRGGHRGVVSAAPAWALVVLMVVAVGMSTIAIWAGLCFGGDQ